MKRLLYPYSSLIKFLYNEGHKSLFIFKFYFRKVKILYLYPDPKLGTIFASHDAEAVIVDSHSHTKLSTHGSKFEEEGVWKTKRVLE